MLNRELLEGQLAELPLYVYDFIDPKALEFTERVLWVCSHECPMYDKTWACPPAVGTVDECRCRCEQFTDCLMIATITEVQDISNIEETLATRPAHEAVTNQVRDMMRSQGVEPYVLSTEACALCERCAWMDGQPCRFPEKMHPCVESHGINLLALIADQGLEFQYGENVVTWFSLLFFEK
jgi:predicted metal-binding protein